MNQGPDSSAPAQAPARPAPSAPAFDDPAAPLPQYGPDDLRWTPRRIRNTASYAVIGFFIGGLMGMVMLAIGSIFLHAAMSPFLLIGLAILALGPLGIYRASDGTCRATPVAPPGICIGLFIGAMFAIPIGFQLMKPASLAIPGGIILGACFAVAGYYGSKQGVRRRFGLPQLGVGIVCAHCGYDVSATPDHAVCPECGGHYRYAAMPPT